MSAIPDDRPVALVTGHQGFIGRALYPELSDLGWQVSGLTDDNGLAVDLRDAEAVRAAIIRLRPQVILHLGGVSGPMQLAGDSASILRINVEGTQTVLDSAALNDVPRVMLAGSVAGYAVCGPDGPEPESLYGLTKRVVEHQARLWTRSTGGSATILRIGSVYGPGRTSVNPMHDMVEMALTEGVIRVAPHRMEPCIEIRSCARLIASLTRVPAWRMRYDLVTDRPHSVEVATLIAEMTGAAVQVQEEDRAYPTFPEDFDPAPLMSDTKQNSLTSLKEGLAGVIDAYRNTIRKTAVHAN